MVIYTHCEMITKIRVTHPSPHIVKVFFLCVVRRLKISAGFKYTILCY